MIELLIGFGIASWLGAGGTFLFLTLFALAFPRLFRVCYWLFMLPIMSLGFAGMGWLLGGFVFGWGGDVFQFWLVCGTVFGLVFCKLTDPA